MRQAVVTAVRLFHGERETQTAVHASQTRHKDADAAVEPMAGIAR